MVKIVGVAFAFSPSDGRRACSGRQAFTALKLDGYAPAGADLSLLVVRELWWEAADLIEGAAEGADAVVLFAPGLRTDGADVARYARNEADASLRDASRMRWPGSELIPGGPAVLASSLSAAGLARAMELSGLPASDAALVDADVANRCFHAVLARTRALAGLVRLPRSLESARAQGERGAVNRMQILSGVRAALAFSAAAVEARRADAA
jgi:pyrrolidone-carboxylate peptidase